MIVPTEEYNILKKYLGANDKVGLVLVPEESIRSFPPIAQAKCRELAYEEDVPYDFGGGDPDIQIDLILSQESYAYGDLLCKSELD